MKDRILFVDDEANIIEAYRRTLRKEFNITGVYNGDDALELLKNGDYAVVISDMQMPGMNGVEFLAAAKEVEPDTVRIMLTGNADIKTAIDAVNKGDIFRFHNKPCHPDIMKKTINDALKLYHLIIAEKELLEGTLTGSIQILTDLLSLINPEAFGRTSQIKQYVLSVAKEMNIEETWEIEAMSSLALIGCIILPDEATKKLYCGDKLNAEEQQIFDMHPFIGSDLISKIPRMQYVADGIKYQEKLFSGEGIPLDDVSGKNIPLGARILKVVLDYDRQISAGKTREQAVEHLNIHSLKYDPDVLATFVKCLEDEAFPIGIVQIKDLKEGMFLTEDLYTREKVLIICKGQETTSSVRNKLLTLHNNKIICGTIEVINKNNAANSEQATGNPGKVVACA